MKLETRINLYSTCALALVLSAAVSSCSSSSCDKQTGTTENSAVSEDTRVAFTTVNDIAVYTLPGTDSLFSMDHDATFGAQASLIMPTYVSGSDINTLRTAVVAAAVGKTVTDSPEKALKDYVQSTVDSLGYPGAVLLPDSTDTSRADGFINIYGNVVSMSPRILSYAVTQYFYPIHAANGETSLTYVNYDFMTGKVMTLQDIFTPEGLKALPAIIADRAKATSPDAKITALPASGSYYVDYEGRLVFVYQQGEVSYRAAGAVTASFYPQELQEYMTPAGKSFLI